LQSEPEWIMINPNRGWAYRSVSWQTLPVPGLRFFEASADDKHTQLDALLAIGPTSSLGPFGVRASGRGQSRRVCFTLCTDYPHRAIYDTRKRDQLRRRCRKAEVCPPNVAGRRGTGSGTQRDRDEHGLNVLGRILHLMVHSESQRLPN
jgi:hypothetical protein